VFVRVKRSVQPSGTYEYLQIVESIRDGGRVRQRVRATLGRRDQLVATGTLDTLVQALARFSERLRVVEHVRTAASLQAHTARAWGPALVFGRLWETQGVPALLRRLAADRRFEFDPERTAFALALQRLCAPGSDLQGVHWLPTIECPGTERLALQHLYRTVAFLAEGREDLEQALFLQDRDLFHQELDLVFLDTTSTYVWRPTETALRRRGYSRDRRPEQPQIVLCVAVDRRGWPVAWDILPGNTGDHAAFTAMVTRLRERFHIGRVIVVADRGMLSRQTLALLTADGTAPFDYILGCRLRQQTEVAKGVLARAGRYQPVADNLAVKEVRLGDRRYVVCRNPEAAKKDAAARAALVAKLEATLQHGPKAVLGNKGFARFLSIRPGSVTLNRAALAADARLDGKFVLRTNTALPAAEVARAYKGLWRVERTFREQKSTLEVRPLYHHRDDTSIGHIVASFLALRLEVDLQRRLDERGVEVAWPDLMRDLGQVQAVEVTVDGRRYRLRTDLTGSAHHAFAAAGVRPPPPVTPLGSADAAPHAAGSL
jgi:hypothetical protein